MLALFIYEHCPYCVRPRIIADIKGIDYQRHILANDDIEAHLVHIGKKQVPFLQTDDNHYIVESLDICDYFDQIDGKPILKPSQRSDLIELSNKINQASRSLVYPRFLEHPLNYKDFPNKSAKDYFISKKSSSVGDFELLLAHPSLQTIAETQQSLDELAQHLSADFIQAGYISYDDIIIFPILRNLTLISDLVVFPHRVKAYIDFIAKQTQIELYA